MTIKDLIDLLQDDCTPLYIKMTLGDTCDDRNQQARINPQCVLHREAFADYVVESILPIEEENSPTGYGAGLVVNIKTEIRPVKKEV